MPKSHVLNTGLENRKLFQLRTQFYATFIYALKRAQTPNVQRLRDIQAVVYISSLLTSMFLFNLNI